MSSIRELTKELNDNIVAKDYEFFKGLYEMSLVLEKIKASNSLSILNVWIVSISNKNNTSDLYSAILYPLFFDSLSKILDALK